LEIYMNTGLQLQTGPVAAFSWGEDIVNVSGWLCKDPHTNNKLPAAVRLDMENGRSYLAILAGSVVGHVALKRFVRPVEALTAFQDNGRPHQAAHWGISGLVICPDRRGRRLGPQLLSMVTRVAIAGAAFDSPIFPPAQHVLVSAVAAGSASQAAFKSVGFQSSSDIMIADAHGYNPDHPLEPGKEVVAKLARVPWPPVGSDLL
jgi:acetyltransferase (GNAT) family protein